MTTATVYVRVGLLAAVGLAVGACSSSSDGVDSGKRDGGRDGSSDGTAVDVARPDGPLTDLAPPDVPLADAPVEHAALDRGIDTGAVDTGGVDGSRPDTVDAPALDGGALDGAAALVARGKYLVDNLIACSDCHTPKLPSGAPDMSLYLAGNAAFVQLPNGDALPSRNLTPDMDTGLGKYTADQIKRMIMDGVVPTPTGDMALNPVMPYYVFHNMAGADADAVVAYLQSVPAIRHALPDRSPSFDLPTPANYLDPATIPLPMPSYPRQPSATRGRYLATQIGLCIECHTKHLPPGPIPLDTSKFFQGGEDFSDLFAGTLNIHPVSANLTSDPTTGLGDWTVEQIVNVLLKGQDDQGVGICPPMPVGPDGAYGGLTTEDARDIANYIKSLPPAVNDVPDICSWPPVTPAVDGGGLDMSRLDATSG